MKKGQVTDSSQAAEAAATYCQDVS